MAEQTAVVVVSYSLEKGCVAIRVARKWVLALKSPESRELSFDPKRLTYVLLGGVASLDSSGAEVYPGRRFAGVASCLLKQVLAARNENQTAAV